MKHPVLQVREHEGQAQSLAALMHQLARRLAGRRGPTTLIGVRCEPCGQWVIDLSVGLVRGSSDSLEVDERAGHFDLVLEGPEPAMTHVLNGLGGATELESLTVRGDPNALEELLTSL